MKSQEATVAAATRAAIDHLKALIPTISDALADLAAVARMAPSEGEQVRLVYTITAFAIDQLRDGVSAALVKRIVPERNTH